MDQQTISIQTSSIRPVLRPSLDQTNRVYVNQLSKPPKKVIMLNSMGPYAQSIPNAKSTLNCACNECRRACVIATKK